MTVILPHSTHISPSPLNTLIRRIIIVVFRVEGRAYMYTDCYARVMIMLRIPLLSY